MAAQSTGSTLRGGLDRSDLVQKWAVGLRSRLCHLVLHILRALLHVLVVFVYVTIQNAELVE